MTYQFFGLLFIATFSRVVGELLLDEARDWKARRALARVIAAAEARMAAEKAAKEAN